MTVNTNNPVVRGLQIAEHKQEVIKFKTYLGVAQMLHNKIEQAIDPKWLEVIRSPCLFSHTSLLNK
jgi:hypothetical protein